jgi:25S rRNA (uracil2634-N3)-methyltransferase
MEVADVEVREAVREMPNIPSILAPILPGPKQSMGGGKKSKSLSIALASQQTRLKKKAQAEHAAQQRLKQDTTKGKGKGKAPPMRNVIPFAATDRILLIGEGNFSFTHALVFDPPKVPSSPYASTSLGAPSSHTLEFLPPANVTATAYDTEDECYTKYPEAVEVVRALREKGVEILFGVNATKLEKCASLKGRRFDRIVWNFPHAGKGIADQDRNILSNQTLMLDFLRSVPLVLEQGSIPTMPSRQKKEADDDEDMLMEDEEVNDGPAKALRGTVLITLRNVPPYTLW